MSNDGINILIKTTSTGGGSGGGNDPSFDPCSNDNPEFDKETQPCLNSVMDTIFEGAFLPTTTSTLPTLPKFDVSKFNLDAATTVAPDLTTAEMEMTTTVVADELPSFYSCIAASEDDLTEGNNHDNLTLTFKYEIYTPSTMEDYTSALSTLERRLTNGVASSLGLAAGDCSDGDGDGLAIEVSVRSSTNEGEDLRKLMPLRGMRRTLQTGNGMDSAVQGLSMDPADELDAETGK